MKRLTIILVVGLVIMANGKYPVFAMGHGMMGSGTKGSGMMGNWGSALMDWWQKWQNKGGDNNLRNEQMYRLKRLEQEYYDETTNLRKAIKTRSTELEAVLNSPNPDIEKARILQREINDLRARMDEKRLNYELEARKINQDDPSVKGYRGTGHHMDGVPVMDYGNMQGAVSKGYRN